MVDLSIIIVNYKTPQLILDCLSTVYEHTKGLSFEIIIVDNDSRDQSRGIITHRYPSVRWIDMGYNSGFSRANNRGMDEARGRLILLLNSDTLLRDNVLKRCADVLDNQPDVAAVGPMQITRQGEVHHQIYNKFAQIRKSFYIIPHTPFFQKILDKLVPENHYDDPNQVDWLSGACLMTRRSTIEKAGRLDENFFMYGEDVEWGWRLHQQGRMLMLRDAFIVHLEYGSSPEYQKIEMLSYINRFRPQMQISNLLWVRKQYGVLAYLMLILHYLVMVPVVFLWKILINLRDRKFPFYQLGNQFEFARSVKIFLRFFWKTLRNEPGFYKI